jgi:carboxyl-terminal processing protease
MNPNRSSRFTPLIVACSVVIGIIIGSFYANHFSGNRLSIINTSSNKLNDLLQIVDAQYVDKVNISDLVEKSMPKILAELDPHSTYTSARDVEESMQDLKGSFSGIGVQFTILDDTIRIISVIEGGPSKAAGILPGDCIVAVNGKPFVGKKVTNDEAVHKLKGPKGSKVTVGVLRAGEKEIRSFTLQRDDIPIKSIQTAYMLDEKTGYVKVDQFADSTYPEFLVALAKLGQQGATSLVLDLRGNHGGFVQPAIRMACEFLPAGNLVFYMQGRHSPREDFVSDGRGTHQTTPLVVLVDEQSASASEIFAGSMQDNDRAMIVGRRSFGKGLVQESIEFRDGSMLRLTIARYYMPSGRCVQKPYTPGDLDDYDMDIIRRMKSGELESGDSIKEHGKKFYTRLKRTVYGENGITPDVFVPEQAEQMTSYFKEAAMKGLLNKYAYIYTNNNRPALSKLETWQEVAAWLKKHDVVEQFAKYAADNGLPRRNLLIRKSHHLLLTYLSGYIIDDLMGRDALNRYLNSDDKCVSTALQLINDGKAFPQKPDSAVAKGKTNGKGRAS